MTSQTTVAAGHSGVEREVPGPVHDAGLTEALAAITDPVLFVRLFDMLAAVKRELGSQDLDPSARARAAVVLTIARSRLRDALSSPFVAEVERLVPEFTGEPSAAELRLAYGGTLAWLAGVARLAVTPRTPPGQAGERPE